MLLWKGSLGPRSRYSSADFIAPDQTAIATITISSPTSFYRSDSTYKSTYCFISSSLSLSPSLLSSLSIYAHLYIHTHIHIHIHIYIYTCIYLLTSPIYCPSSKSKLFTSPSFALFLFHSFLLSLFLHPLFSPSPKKMK